MKGEITLKILEALGSAAIGFADIAEALLAAGYGASRWRVGRELSRIELRHARNRMARDERMRAEQRYREILSKLKRDGLVRVTGHRGNLLFSLTARGENKRAMLTVREQDALPSHYKARGVAPRWVIVAFDIPEQERRKRAWLRSVLKHFGLHMVQKSVWIGKVIFPKEFLDDLDHFRLADYIEIFEVTKAGSLRHIA
jgi:DNA-binding transcriptional regulator PaaX